MNQTAGLNTIEHPDIAKQAQKEAGLTLLTFLLMVALIAGLILWKSADAVDATTGVAPSATVDITHAN